MESTNGIHNLITVNEFQPKCCKKTAFNNRSVSSCNTADKQLGNDTNKTFKSTLSVNEKISEPSSHEVVPCNSADNLNSEDTPDEELMEEGLIEIDDNTPLDRALDDFAARDHALDDSPALDHALDDCTALDHAQTYDSHEQPSELWNEMIAHEFAKKLNLSQR